MATKTSVQDYPRISNPGGSDDGCIDESFLVPHTVKISEDKVKEFVAIAIDYASRRSKRESITIPPDVDEKEIARIYENTGIDLFNYFQEFCGDPAATAHQIYQKNYRDVGAEQFRNRTLQKERMNSGWRYQKLAIDCANASQRFRQVADLGLKEADFSAIIDFIDKTLPPLALYVSVKNRENTLGGQDWPKAIRALEDYAKNDRNRPGLYCGVFGLAMDKSTRRIIKEKLTGRAHSEKVELWPSDFFWPFFANYNYEDIMRIVLDVLVATDVSPDELVTKVPVPDPVLDSFGKACQETGLLDELGNFNDPYKLVEFFCGKYPPKKKLRKPTPKRQAEESTAKKPRKKVERTE